MLLQTAIPEQRLERVMVAKPAPEAAPLTGRELTDLRYCTFSVGALRRKGHYKGSQACKCVYHRAEVADGKAPCGHLAEQSLPLLLNQVRCPDAGVEGVPVDWDGALNRWYGLIATRLFDLLPERLEQIAEHGVELPDGPSSHIHVTACQCLALVDGSLRASAYVRAAALAELKRRAEVKS